MLTTYSEFLFARGRIFCKHFRRVSFYPRVSNSPHFRIYFQESAFEFLFLLKPISVSLTLDWFSYKPFSHNMFVIQRTNCQIVWNSEQNFVFKKTFPLGLCLVVLEFKVVWPPDPLYSKYVMIGFQPILYVDRILTTTKIYYRSCLNIELFVFSSYICMIPTLYREDIILFAFLPIDKH